MNNVAVHSQHRLAELLVDYLVDHGPCTSRDVCGALGWSKGRFSTAVRYARSELCPDMGLAIPQPTPQAGWLYQVTTEWQPVEEGSSFALGLVESRLRSIATDVATIKPHLTRGSKEWRRANFLDKHLSHIVATLTEINDG